MEHSYLKLLDEQITALITSDVDLGYGMEPTLYVNIQKDVKAWCDENLKESIDLEHDTSVNMYGEAFLNVTLYFGSPEDAIYFKLRWL